jgi:hypothetical protein
MLNLEPFQHDRWRFWPKRTKRGTAINDQADRQLGARQQPFEEFNEYIGANPALFLDRRFARPTASSCRGMRMESELRLIWST